MQTYIRKYIPLALMMTLFSEIHFYPLSGTLRLSLGIVFIHLIGLMRDDIHLPSLTLLSGLLIGTERFLGQTIIFHQSTFDALKFVQPSLVYYSSFATLHLFINLRKRKNTMFSCILVMAAIDALSNSLEAILRQGFTLKLLQIVILAGFLRALIAFALYIFWMRQSLFIQNQEHQKRYVQLTSLAAGVETELFYLRKSADQIENVMRQSYRLYDELPTDLGSKASALEIARDIHEIKKDYLRVLSGFDDFINKLENIEELSLTEILTIVRSSSEKVILDTGKTIKLSFTQDGEVMIQNYLNIFTILNNLIDNSIAAASSRGHIQLTAVVIDNTIHFSVLDDGSGIQSELKDVIFNPGFTTKYDSKTGKASTGIGLSHVKNLVMEMQGDIQVNSGEGHGTQFDIQLPINQ